MMLQYDSTGRAAVVTGAAGGMGKAVARGILTAGGPEGPPHHDRPHHRLPTRQPEWKPHKDRA